MNRYKRRSTIRKKNRKIALGNIFLLFQMAREIFDLDPELAQSYAKRARKIGMRYEVRIPTQLRRAVCRHCKKLIIPGKTCIVRIKQKRESHVVITCLYCNNHMRLPLRSIN